MWQHMMLGVFVNIGPGNSLSQYWCQALDSTEQSSMNQNTTFIKEKTSEKIIPFVQPSMS